MKSSGNGWRVSVEIVTVRLIDRYYGLKSLERLLYNKPNYKYNSPIGLKAVYNEIVSSARNKYAHSNKTMHAKTKTKNKRKFLCSIVVSIIPVPFGGHVIRNVLLLLERRVCLVCLVSG